MERIELDGRDLLGAWIARSPYPPEMRPERRLMLAVLEQAFEDLRLDRRNLRARGRYRGTRILPAEAWFAHSSSAWPFSFERLCDHLGLDAPSIRRMVCIPIGSLAPHR